MQVPDFLQVSIPGFVTFDEEENDLLPNLRSLYVGGGGGTDSKVWYFLFS